MVRRLNRWAVVLWVVALGCSTSKVIKEGPGWREVEGASAGQTMIEITTNDPQALAELARTAPDPRIRTEAIRRVKDPAVLADLVRRESDPALRRAIAGELTDEKVLKELSTSDPDEGVRQAAAARAQMLRTVDARHPEYAGWVHCKPGAWIRLKVDLKIDDSRTSVEIVRTLLDCGPDRAVLEQKLVSTGKGSQDMWREMLTRFDLALGRKVEDQGDLEISGRTRKCRWVRYHFQRGGDIAQIRRWHLDEVPGGVARIDLDVSPEGQPLRSLTAVATAWENR